LESAVTRLSFSSVSLIIPILIVMVPVLLAQIFI
jgi:hypothetical protein